MIIVRLIGGLGNQLFQYAIGRKMSLLYDVELKLDVSALQDDPSRTYKLHNYNISAPIASAGEVRKYTWLFEDRSFLARSLRKLHRKGILPYNISYIREKEYYKYEPRLERCGRSCFLEGFWQNARYYVDLDERITEELQLGDVQKREADKLLSGFDFNASTISIHIRRGDYLSCKDNLQYFGVLGKKYYDNAIAHMNKTVSEARFLVFSDDPASAKQMLTDHSNLQFVEIEGGTKEYIELEAMRRCGHNIIANSSFSWWGAFLNPNPDKVVISPKQWLATPELNAPVNIQMQEWIRI